MRQTGSESHRLRERDRETGMQTEIQGIRETGRQTDRQADS